jgi:hypothetical protein
LYENVQIDMPEHDRDTPKDNVSQINVLWMKVSCPYAPSNKSLDARGGGVFRIMTGPARLE